jgi:transcriptional regulator with XRE-family HTH domain
MEILALGDKIKRQRKSLGLTLKDIAGDCITSAQLSYIESGKCRPSESLLRFICEKINLDVDYAVESEVHQAEKYCEFYLKEYEAYAEINDMDAAEKRLEMAEKIAADYKLEACQGIVKFKKGLNEIVKHKFSSAQLYLLTALQTFIK